MSRQHVLFIGSRKEMDEYLVANGIPTTEHGRSVFWAQNGPSHLDRAQGRILIVSGPEERELNEFEVAAMVKAKWMNDEEDRI